LVQAIPVFGKRLGIAAIAWMSFVGLGFALLGGLDGYSLGKPFFLVAAILWLLNALASLGLFVCAIILVITSIQKGQKLASLLAIALIVAAGFGVVVLPRIYGFVYPQSERFRFEQVGLAALRSEVSELLTTSATKWARPIDQQSLPPHLKLVTKGHLFLLTADGLSVTTEGLGDYRSGFIIAPAGVNHPEPSDPVEGIHVWSGKE
jgi:hypothetical protein